MKKIILISLAIVCAVYFIGSGFRVRGDVGIWDYAVSPNGDEITIEVGVMSSVGYTRNIRNISTDPEKIKLKCYSAFGGINGSIGAEHRFVIPLSPECKEIYLYSFGEYRLEIIKDEATGEWKSTKLPPDRF